MLRKIALSFKNPSVLFWLVILLTLLVHIINIGYNSPSNDEAVYIWIGQNALYKGQWALYNTASWVGGHSYFYPTITAIAYSIGGIVGSRILNIIFSLFCLYFTGKLTLELSLNLTKNKKLSQQASIIAIVLLGFSEVVSYISRLATYDMASFMFFTASLYVLVKTLGSDLKTEEYSKSFIISSALMALSFAFKYITAISMPVVIIFSFFYIKSLAKKDLLKLWLTYFVASLVVFISLITLTQISYLLSYINSQVIREVSSFKELGRVFILEAWTSLALWIAAVTLLIIKKKWRIVFVSTVFIVVIAAFHFLTLRIAAWDKHIFFIVYAFSITTAIGFSEILQHKIWGKILIFVLIAYVVFNIYDAKKYNSIWPDFREASNFMSQNIKENDTLLAEESSSVLLPAKVTTFDWFAYKNLVGIPAYDLALDDGYFKYIELSLGYPVQTKEYKNLENEVLDKMRDSYSQIYKDKYFIVYKLDL